MALEQWLIRGLWLIQAWAREGYGIYNWDVGQACSTEAGMTLQKPEVRRVFSPVSCPWIMGPWQWWAAQAPGGGRGGGCG